MVDISGFGAGDLGIKVEKVSEVLVKGVPVEAIILWVLGEGLGGGLVAGEAGPMGGGLARVVGGEEGASRGGLKRDVLLVGGGLGEGFHLGKDVVEERSPESKRNG
jgi:hypothetical protein